MNSVLAHNPAPPDPINPDRLLTEGEVEEIFGLSRRWLQSTRIRGHGGPVYRKFGRSVRYRAGDIRAFIDSSARTSTADTGSAN